MPRVDSFLWNRLCIPSEKQLLIQSRLTKRTQYCSGFVQDVFNAIRIKTRIFKMRCGENNAIPSTARTLRRQGAVALFAALHNKMKFTV